MSTLKNEENSQGKEIIHTTLTREIRLIRNWCEWLARWQAAETVEEMLGLLHFGFDATFERYKYDEKEYDYIDCLIFYFTIANGWADSYLLELPEDKGIKYKVCNQEGRIEEKCPRELRHQLAVKAFDMLCLKFFKTELKNSRDPYKNLDNYVWEDTIVSKRLLPVIQNFFRVEKRRFGDRMEICNLSRCDDQRSHNERQAINFIINLTKFIWKWREKEIRSYYKSEEQELIIKQNDEMRSRLDSSKLWMIEILSELGKLDVLREWILELDKACLAKLKEIALRSELKSYYYPVKENRLVASLDEARYLGSRTAWFLAEYELKMKEHKRLTLILDAERKKENADREIAKLTAKK